MAQFAPQYDLMKLIDRIKSFTDCLIVVILVLSILPYLLVYLSLDFDSLIDIANIISISLSFLLELLVEYILVPLADRKRRDDFIDNSFGSAFSTTSSVGYYSNDPVQVGLVRAAANLFENCFFTYSLVKATTVRKIIWPATIMLILAVCSFQGFKNTPIALPFLQALFSMNALGSLVKHCILIVRLNTIQDAWIALFSRMDFKQDPQKNCAYVYRYWLQYEALHSKIPAGIPDKLFKKLNSQLSKDWEDIKIRYNI